jgi:hypothetical protein
MATNAIQRVAAEFLHFAMSVWMRLHLGHAQEAPILLWLMTSVVINVLKRSPGIT